jgi:lysozyme family protein
MDITAIIDGVIAREGGYVNNPNDRGGPTNYGITQAIARSQGYQGAMRDLPRDEAVQMYIRLYWLKPKINHIGDIAPLLAAKLLDIAVNMGPASAIGFLKRALNVMNQNGSSLAQSSSAPMVEDGLLAALKAFLIARGATGETVLIKAVNALQGEKYIALAEARPADGAFVYGWMKNRIG